VEAWQYGKLTVAKTSISLIYALKKSLNSKPFNKKDKSLKKFIFFIS
jgi:hypothetical protein